MKILPLLFLLPVFSFTYGQNINLSISNSGVAFTENKDTILFYQTREKSYNGKYTRANYIHPLYTLDGAVLTEDFPEDHPHHRGIFWTWHQIYIGDKRIGDGWDARDMQWEVRNLKSIPSNAQAKTLQAEVYWYSPLWLTNDGQEKAFAREKVQITVHPRAKHTRIIDIRIALLALERNLFIGGSEDVKGYGGFSTRIRLPDDVRFNGPEGEVIPQNTAVESKGWIEISGAMEKDQNYGGLLVIAHPDNPAYPNRWILRKKASMQNAVYPGKEKVEISTVQPTVLRYRMVLFSDTINPQTFADDFSLE